MISGLCVKKLTVKTDIRLVWSGQTKDYEIVGALLSTQH